MHIAHYTNTYYPVVSGVVRSISAFRQALIQQGHQVFIFSQAASDYEDTEPFVFRYPAIELPIHNHFPITIPVSSHIDWLMPALKLDVIHAHHPILLGQTAARKASELGLPFVFTYHTRYREYSHYAAINQNLVKEVIDRWMGVFLQQCQHIIVPTESIHKLLADLYGITKGVTVIPTGIDIEPYETVGEREKLREELGWTDKKVLISLGRLAKEKNWNVLIEAATAALREDESRCLVILGEGEERAGLEKQIKKAGLEKQVLLPGQIPFAQVPRYMTAADLFCFASVTETQGLVTLEAMAAGLPVVAYDASGTSDAVTHEKEGLLTENEPAALGAAIQRVLGDADLHNRLREAALLTAREYDIRRQASRMADVYEKAIEAKKAEQAIAVDRKKPLLEGHWYSLLGLEENPFEQLATLVQRE
ncbi:MAG: glycosyltransferase [Anaerolineales bacterium]|nr:glycosyltransferase [Anaerolineales bacterium]MCB0008358.1 glycosyltransferase [Anaerolineales bacterium]MCB0018135.1 glycosyltransferase [Anaerolineales bacterium]MCB8959959.1 glycosyltransferase [Ardenticatenales bacterium]